MKRIMFNDKYGLTQAVLEGRKTMIRTIATYEDIMCPNIGWGLEGNDKGKRILCKDVQVMAMSFYAKGEIVAIAQAYRDIPWFSERENVCRNMPEYTTGWTNKMFVAAKYMPHHIRITDIKVERLQDISYDDCLKEGVYMRTEQHPRQEFEPEYTFGEGKYHAQNPIAAFAALIDKVSGKGTWESNPFVFAYSFELID